MTDPIKTYASLNVPNNWNRVDDDYDLAVWNKLTSQFWLPEKVPVSNDIAGWGRFKPEERLSTVRVFAGLTKLDTLQAEVGAPSLVPDALNHIEASVYANITFMEAVHAKSYSSIFATLCSSDEIEDAFEWADNNEQLQTKEEIVRSYYAGADPLERKVASVLLESFLFYSGFYMPFHWSSRAKLTNTADMIRLIVRDESVHGTYIGYKFQRGLDGATDARRAELQEFTINLLMDLYENELQYTADIYDPLGLTEDVKKFLSYNANKALQNLGYESLFAKDQTDVNPAILASLDPTSETHDFFSGSGSSYIVATHEETTDDDWA
jgi:ribonucleoside-diphosphate reductase beta chain